MGNVYELYMVKPVNGRVVTELSGRYALHAGHLFILEDRFGHLLQVGDGPLDARRRSLLDGLARAMYYEVKQTDETWTPETAIAGRVEPTHAIRLAHGAQMREQMKALIASGQRPSGHRAEWLYDTALKLLEVLGEEQRTFELAHLDDAISVADQLDALTTASGMLQRNAKGWMTGAPPSSTPPGGDP